MKTTLSIKLLHTLLKGKRRLGSEAIQRVSGFIESQRTSEDAFMNKSGETDVYYTSFGWLLSHILGIGLNTEKKAAYLDKQLVSSMDLVHYAAYMRCRMLHRLAKKGKWRSLLNAGRQVSVRSLDSFEHLPHADKGSPYTRFIWMSLLEDTQNREEKEQLLAALEPYHVPEGGYSNLRDRRVATTNATVAALAVIGQTEGYKRDNKDLLYLQNTQHSTGGFKAGEGAPVPDLLSTATALFMMKCYGMRPLRSASDFIEAHWLDSGGFSATLLEDSSDVEYTFYGLLALGAV